MRKEKLNLAGILIVYLSLTAVFAFAFPEKAVAKSTYFDYFVGDKLNDYCVNNLCFDGSDIIKTDDDNIVISVYKNKAYKNEDECKIVLGGYIKKIEGSGYFPLHSTKTDFGGLFTVNKKDYHAKMKCSNNFMLAKITTI